MLPDYDASAVSVILGLALHARDNTRAIDATADQSGSDGHVSGVRGGPGRGSPASSSVLVEKAVEEGLPRSALRGVAVWLAGGDMGKVAAFERDVVPKTTLDRRNTKLSVHESERTERIARLAVHARRALGTDTEARAFMTAAHPELDDRSPMEAAKTDLGTRRVELILTALEYGLAL